MKLDAHATATVVVLDNPLLHGRKDVLRWRVDLPRTQFPHARFQVRVHCAEDRNVVHGLSHPSFFQLTDPRVRRLTQGISAFEITLDPTSPFPHDRAA